MSMSDSNKPKLPKPVTVTGSSFDDPEPTVTDQQNNISDSSAGDNSVLPMPAAVYEDDEEEEDVVPEKNTPNNDSANLVTNESPLDNLLPKIEPASSDPNSEPIVNLEKNEQVNPIQNDTSLPSLPVLDKVDTAIPEASPNASTSFSTTIPTEPNEIGGGALQPTGLDHEQVDQINLQPQELTSDQFNLPQIDVNQIPNEVSALSGNTFDSLQQETQPTIQQMPTYAPLQSANIDQATAVHPNPPKTNGMSKALLGIGIFLIGGGLVVGGYFGITSLRSKDSVNTPSIAYQEPTPSLRPIQSPEPSETASASATPKTSPKASPRASAAPSSDDLVKVHVLNGSGAKGEALNAKNELDLKKYSISTGNADNFDYIGLTIEYKAEYKAEAQNVAVTLSKTRYPESTYGKATLEATLQDDNDYDIIVTVGSSTSNPSPSPSPKASPTPTPKP